MNGLRNGRKKSRRVSLLCCKEEAWAQPSSKVQSPSFCCSSLSWKRYPQRSQSGRQLTRRASLWPRQRRTLLSLTTRTIVSRPSTQPSPRPARPRREQPPTHATKHLPPPRNLDSYPIQLGNPRLMNGKSCASDSLSPHSALERALGLGKTDSPLPDPLFSPLSSPIFVTWNLLSRNTGTKRLRGCIGTFEARPIGEGLQDYALIRWVGLAFAALQYSASLIELDWTSRQCLQR